MRDRGGGWCRVVFGVFGWGGVACAAGGAELGFPGGGAGDVGGSGGERRTGFGGGLADDPAAGGFGEGVGGVGDGADDGLMGFGGDGVVAVKGLSDEGTAGRGGDGDARERGGGDAGDVNRARVVFDGWGGMSWRVVDVEDGVDAAGSFDGEGNGFVVRGVVADENAAGPESPDAAETVGGPGPAEAGVPVPAAAAIGKPAPGVGRGPGVAGVLPDEGSVVVGVEGVVGGGGVGGVGLRLVGAVCGGGVDGEEGGVRVGGGDVGLPEVDGGSVGAGHGAPGAVGVEVGPAIALGSGEGVAGGGVGGGVFGSELVAGLVPGVPGLGGDFGADEIEGGVVGVRAETLAGGDGGFEALLAGDGDRAGERGEGGAGVFERDAEDRVGLGLGGESCGVDLVGGGFGGAELEVGEAGEERELSAGDGFAFEGKGVERERGVRGEADEAAVFEFDLGLSGVAGDEAGSFGERHVESGGLGAGLERGVVSALDLEGAGKVREAGDAGGGFGGGGGGGVRSDVLGGKGERRGEQENQRQETGAASEAERRCHGAFLG